MSYFRKKNCEECKKSIIDRTKNSIKKFCSKACRQKSNNRTYPNTARGRYNTAKKECTRNSTKHKKTKKFLISFKFFEQNIFKKPCHYCGGKVGDYGTGMDRVDWKKPYTKNNVVPCCVDCNSIKSNRLSELEALVLIDALKELRGDIVWEK